MSEDSTPSASSERTYRDSLERLVGQVIADRYRIVKLIGKGGMASVFLGEHVTIAKQVAIKVLSPTLATDKIHIQRFLKEAKAASTIRHRNIVDITDFGYTEDNLPFYAMEYLDGEDLRTMLEREGALSWAQAKPIVMQICAALEAAHQAGIIHRDIKADNCFVYDEGRYGDGRPRTGPQCDEGAQVQIKVLDFGIAKVSSDAMDNTSLTGTGAVLGTADYMSPELAQSRPVDHRTDIYSLGVLIFRMLTGRLPFLGKGWLAVLKAHTTTAPPSLSALAPQANIHPDLEAAVLTALAKSPEDRFQHVAEFANALHDIPVSGQSNIARSGIDGASRLRNVLQRGPRSRPISAFELAPTDAEQTNPWLPEASDTGGGGAYDANRELSSVQAEGMETSSPETTTTQTVPPKPKVNDQATTETTTGTATRTLRLSWMTLSILFAVALAAGAALTWWIQSEAPASTDIDEELLRSFAPLPSVVASPKNPLNTDKIDLGRMLFYEARLSKNHDISCNSCHDLARFGVDGRRFSLGHAGEPSTRNSPSVYHAAGQFVQFWDGRTSTIEEQATLPILNNREMAMPEGRALDVLRSIPEYVERFSRAFPDSVASPEGPVTMTNVGLALAAFERRLLTPGRWDRFLSGERTALTDLEKQGFNLFVYKGCVTCHFGPYVGGSMYQKLGLIKPWVDNIDRGRFEVTKNNADWMVFKVPSLRNITKTGPYFHNGSISSLDEAVRRMAIHQLGKTLGDAEVEAIVAWLGTLEGAIPHAYIEPPTLPPSTPETPRPERN